MFLLALTFTQAKLIARVERVKPILLIDDIGAELDINSRKALSKALDILDCQVIITAIEYEVLIPFFDRFSSIKSNNDDYISNDEILVTAEKAENYKVFHVKHGEVSAMYPNNSDLKPETAIE